ncbi:hypothetical protein BGZ46_008241 [Entomortierella lignicola]|nr:hypothetical protein BGZ46_008241 [Entomortierella lignicola]
MGVLAKSFVGLEYVSIGVFIHQQDDEKKIEFKSRWERVALRTFRNYFNRKDNGVALITGDVIDLIVVSRDPLDDGGRTNGIGYNLASIEALLQDGTPIKSRPNGGRQYLFSLSKSTGKGLNNTKSNNKIKVNNYPMSIDTHANTKN